jgi:two-component sensor histidine kinase
LYRIPALRKIILTDTPPLNGVAWTVLAVAAPTTLRWIIDRGEAGIPFVTYFPAIVLTALFLGWRYGVAAALFSGIAANRLLNAAPLMFYTSARDALFFALYALTCAILIYIAEMSRRLIRQQEEASRREILLNAELVHRMKNILATVNSIAAMSARHSDPKDFAEAFNGRIAALGRATDQLSAMQIMSCELGQLVESVIAPFRDDANFDISGPECDISRDSCIPLALVLHELCTNAAKHGALSVPEGRISLEWEIHEGPERRALIGWREKNGPPVEPIERRGMGMGLLQPQAGLADVRVDFPRDGAICEIALALMPSERN